MIKIIILILIKIKFCKFKSNKNNRKYHIFLKTEVPLKYLMKNNNNCYNNNKNLLNNLLYFKFLKIPKKMKLLININNH